MFLPSLGVQCGVYTELGLAAEGWMLCDEVTLSKKSVGANLSKLASVCILSAFGWSKSGCAVPWDAPLLRRAR